ncbi:unnamed protein product, partial [Brassica napus]
LIDHILVLRLATGNAKANQYWESELPLHFERSSSDAFIRAKYNEKKWVSPGGIQPSPIASQLSCKVSHLVETGYKPATPKKARTLSLDEDLLLKHALQVTPPETRIRACGAKTETRRKEKGRCVICHGTGRVDCFNCSGKGRTNCVDMEMLPKGEWPKW